MFVFWKPDRGPVCKDHGQLADAPLPNLDAGILTLEHFRDAHGKDGPEMTAALAKVRAHKALLAGQSSLAKVEAHKAALLAGQS